MKTSPTAAKKTGAGNSVKDAAEQMPVALPQASAVNNRLAYRHRRYGWTSLLIFISFGTLLEGLLGFKSIGLLFDPLRRELWSLAHFHGAMLAIVNIVYTSWADNVDLRNNQNNSASWSLILGSVCMPLGFFLAGISHPEGDPGIAIFLVPIGALMICYAIGVQALAAWRKI